MMCLMYWPGAGHARFTKTQVEEIGNHMQVQHSATYSKTAIACSQQND